MNKKSRESTILPMSVVTRLLIFPTRLLALLDPDFSPSALTPDFLLEVDFVLLVSAACTSDEGCAVNVESVTPWECRVSSSLTEPLPFPSDSSAAELIVDASLASLSWGASALTRIRRECSKTSWVMMHSARTRVRVWTN